MVELHHPAAGPRTVGLRPRIAVHDSDLVAPAGERHRREQPGRARPDNDDPHSPLLGLIPENESAGPSTVIHR